MSALFLAIPLTLFVLFVLPVWIWLHYSNRSRSSGLTQNEQQRLLQLSVCANAFRRWKPFWMQSTRTGGINNGLRF